MATTGRLGHDESPPAADHLVARDRDRHPLAQLRLAREMGIRIGRGDPSESRAGEAIVIPERPDQVR